MPARYDQLSGQFSFFGNFLPQLWSCIEPPAQRGDEAVVTRSGLRPRGLCGRFG